MKTILIVLSLMVLSFSYTSYFPKTPNVDTLSLTYGVPVTFSCSSQILDSCVGRPTWMVDSVPLNWRPKFFGTLSGYCDSLIAKPDSSFFDGKYHTLMAGGQMGQGGHDKWSMWTIFAVKYVRTAIEQRQSSILGRRISANAHNNRIISKNGIAIIVK